MADCVIIGAASDSTGVRAMWWSEIATQQGGEEVL